MKRVIKLVMDGRKDKLEEREVNKKAKSRKERKVQGKEMR
jgi:hypothetical protein